MIQQAYKYVSSSLWPCLALFELKHICQVGGDWYRVSCHGNIIIAAGVFPKELLACQIQWPVLQIVQDSSIYVLEIILGWVCDIISHLICIFYTLFELKFPRN